MRLQNPTDDFLTKLDLIDSHPEIFDKRKRNLDLSKEELEQLRVVVVGDQKLFGSRSPRLKYLKESSAPRLPPRRPGLIAATKYSEIDLNSLSIKNF